MAETLQPYKGTVTPSKSFGMHVARYGFPYTADVDTGGDVILMKADGAVKVGDAVILSTVGKVKIATSGSPIGVVVGAYQNGVPSMYGSGSIGQSFPDATLVFVRVEGTVVVPSTGTVNIGDRLVVSGSTAGAVAAGTTAGAILGRALTASSVSANITVLISLA